MTRFCGDAVSVRGGGNKALTKKDIAKNMEKFIQTGVHPDIQAARERAAANTLPALPDHDANRDFVFLDLRLGQSTVLGRLVVELFTDHVPLPAGHLRNRCLPGSKTGLQGAVVGKLQPAHALWLGKNPAASEGMRFSANPKFKHVDPGCVSISLNGDEVAISLGRALALDSADQVVGRVNKGMDILEKLSDVPVNHMDAPLQRITVVKCGVTNASGAHEELDGDQDGEGAKKDPMQRLAEQSQGARDSVLQALAVGLGQAQKRKADDAQADAGAAAAGKGKGAGPSAQPAAKKSKFLDMGLLGGSDDDDSSSEEEDS